MKKIIFCDRNKELVKRVKSLFNDKNLINNTHCELIVSDKNDIFECKKEYTNAKIITASNPNFSMSGGLDLALREKYPEQCNGAREFKLTNDLFFTITVDENIKATKYLMMRAMFGAYMCSRKNDIIISGLGTGIGGLSVDDFIYYLDRLIKADFGNSNFSYSDFSNSNFSYSDFSKSNFRGSDFRCSNFSNSNFIYSNFSKSDFIYSNFSYSNFSFSNFNDSKFSYSDFSNSDFSYSDFRCSNFSFSNFNDSKFSDSNFSYSDFRCSNFSFSNFNDSKFSDSNFSNSDFSFSNFNDSKFSYSDFSKSNFRGSKFNYKITPEEGKFIGWKKAENYILKLEIQEAKNVSGGFVGRKLRTDKVKVLEIQEINGKKTKLKEVKSNYNKDFIYKLGEIIKEKDYKKDDKIECDKGIHFFITRDEAVNY